MAGNSNKKYDEEEEEPEDQSFEHNFSFCGSFISNKKIWSQKKKQKKKKLFLQLFVAPKNFCVIFKKLRLNPI